MTRKNNHDAGPAQFYAGQTVWVCKSKGRRQRKCMARSTIDSLHNSHQPLDHEQLPVRSELFLRATVLEVGVVSPNDHTTKGTLSPISDDTSDVADDTVCSITRRRRVRVRYPKGSTYCVREDLLLPVIDSKITNEHGPIVLVFSETNSYRRACCVHTGPNENFMEIGCAEGITCQRVLECTAGDDDTAAASTSRRRRILGLDKSEQSIQIATAKYRGVHFVTCNVLDRPTTWSDVLVQQGAPDVVAIDINGNRDLEAVLQCLQVAMDQWLPRLIMVKSRSLYHSLSQCEEN